MLLGSCLVEQFFHFLSYPYSKIFNLLIIIRIDALCFDFLWKIFLMIYGKFNAFLLDSCAKMRLRHHDCEDD